MSEVRLSVLLPTLGRPKLLREAVASLCGPNGLAPEVEVIIGLDEEDILGAAACRDLARRRGVRIHMKPAPATLARKVNQLAAVARGDILMTFANDMAVRDPNWAQRVIAAVDASDAQVFGLEDAINPGFPTFPILRRTVVDTVGFMAAPWFAFWFTDTWWDEIGHMTGGTVLVDVGLHYIDGRGKTLAMRDLRFWAGFFEATRGMRVQQAMQLGADPKALDRLTAECAGRVAHIRQPDFIAEWEARTEGAPTERYATAKREAEAFLTKLPQQPREPRVAVSIPSTGTWQARTASCVAGLTAFSSLSGLGVGVISLEGSMITKQRNDIAATAMRTNADYVLFIDSDMWFPPDALVRLMKHQKDIVGATYCKRVPPYETLGRLLGPMPSAEELTKGGLVEAAQLPGGMLLVKTDVFRRLPWPWFHESYHWPGLSGVAALQSFLRANYGAVPPAEVLDSIVETRLAEWVNDNWDATGDWTYTSEDLNFCHAVRKAGLQIWCDVGLTTQCKHLGVLEVTCTLPSPAAEPQAVAAE